MVQFELKKENPNPVCEICLGPHKTSQHVNMKIKEEKVTENKENLKKVLDKKPEEKRLI